MESLPIFNGVVYTDDFEQTPIPRKGLAEVKVALLRMRNVVGYQLEG